VLSPTDEETAAADAFRQGDHPALQAGAGTGKTSTLILRASTTKRCGRYIAFDRSIAHSAATRFPRYRDPQDRPRLRLRRLDHSVATV
jgi:Rad3-related DNA helicase